MKRYAVFGAGNIGFGVAEKLASDSEVCLFDMKKPDYLSDLIDKNHKISFAKVDAVKEDSVEAAVASLPPDSLDGAILTVGVFSAENALDDLDAFRKTISTNFLGNIIPIRVLVKNKIFRSSAKIVVIASTSGHFAGLSVSAYAPSKWMLVNACHSIRAELEEQGITLDIINPKTIKNVRSDEFTTNKGIEASAVVDTILAILRGGGHSKDRFVPKLFAILHPIERLSPWVLDTLAGLPLHMIRKRRYQDIGGFALITGASSGLGRELVRLLANQCNKIFVTARDLNALEDLKMELTGKCEIVPIQVDFENISAAAAVKAVIGKQKIDLLINNAGHHVVGSLLDAKIEIIEKTMMVNLLNPVALVAAFPEASTVVNILSTTAVAGRRNLGIYSSSKAGLWCFSKALRRTRGKKVHVIDVIPSTFKSSLESKGDKLKVINAEKVDRINHAMGILESKDVAEIVKHGIDKKRDMIYIPRFRAMLFSALEAISPKAFRKLFK